MQVLAIEALIFVVGWFAALGANRGGPAKAVLWAVIGVVIFAIGFYLADFIIEQLLLATGSAIASNGVFVVGKLAGISAGIGLCYLFYWLIKRREQAVAITP